MHHKNLRSQGKNEQRNREENQQSLKKPYNNNNNNIIIQCLYRVTTYHTGITVGPVVSNIPTYLHLPLKIYLIYQIYKLL